MQQICTQPCRQSYTTRTYQKGRREVRKAEVFEAQGEQKKSWCKLKTFLKVTRRGTRQGHRYEWVSYYISDLRLGAREFLKGIRLHSSIENGLHWTKDVLFKEDECRTRMGNGAANLSLLRSFAISVLARTGSTISRMMRMVNNKPEKIAELLE